MNIIISAAIWYRKQIFLWRFLLPLNIQCITNLIEYQSAVNTWVGRLDKKPFPLFMNTSICTSSFIISEATL